MSSGAHRCEVSAVFRKALPFVHRCYPGTLCAALSLLCGPAVHADNSSASPAPGTLFSTLLPDVPGKRLVAVKLEFDPKSPHSNRAHRHPGSVYVYVTRGTLRLGIAGHPVQVVRAGQSFFEPAGELHNVAENASSTEPASAIAVLIVPDGQPLTTFEDK